MLFAQANPSQFSWIDWLVVAGYLVLTTIIGAMLAGKQSTLRDFFLAGRKLPWWAICGSIVATEISAATIIGVPPISFAAGGNLTYLQLALGSILARFIVARYFVDRYYEHEIYSPYDYAGARLGPRVKHTTTALFFLGAVLGQGARLYITASVLGVVAGLKLGPAIWLMGAFSTGWTLLGGMTTVIWTDVIQFGVIILGVIFALFASVSAVPGGAAEVVRAASDAGKFQFFNFSADLSQEYTIWCALIALPFLNLAAFGTDQVLAQRIFCCRTKTDAKKAILWSNVSLFIPLLMLGVGVALYAYYQHHPLSAADAERLHSDQQSLLPLFIVRTLPVGVRGLIVAAIFAASISTLEGALTALSQATISFFVRPGEGAAGMTASKSVIASKALVVCWGVLLCAMAMACIELATQYKNVIDLALSLARYTYGPLLGVFLLALLTRRRDDTGLFWAVGITIAAVLAMSIHHPRSDSWFWAFAGVTAIAGGIRFARNGRSAAVVIVAAALVPALHYLRIGVQPAGDPIYLSTFWHYPIATGMTFGIAYFLGRLTPKENAR